MNEGRSCDYQMSLFSKRVRNPTMFSPSNCGAKWSLSSGRFCLHRDIVGETPKRSGATVKSSQISKAGSVQSRYWAKFPGPLSLSFELHVNSSYRLVGRLSGQLRYILWHLVLSWVLQPHLLNCSTGRSQINGMWLHISVFWKLTIAAENLSRIPCRSIRCSSQRRKSFHTRDDNPCESFHFSWSHSSVLRSLSVSSWLDHLLSH